ncbi:hypothetical protein CFP56_012417 [Quercus suber]|uniref:BED-type domain-containing protein n=1 Tax=Quercus suber TaxID=58331 RepID=A0AAW0KYZ0_QUESU
MSLNLLLLFPLKSLADPSKYHGCPLFFVFSFQPPNPLASFIKLCNMESDEMIPTDIKCEGKDIDLDAQLDEVAKLPLPKKAKTELKVYKRTRTSTILLKKDEGKPTCKCKKCEKEYIAAGADVTENLKRHLYWACPRKFDVPLSIPVSTVADMGNE